MRKLYPGSVSFLFCAAIAGQFGLDLRKIAVIFPGQIQLSYKLIVLSLRKPRGCWGFLGHLIGDVA